MNQVEQLIQTKLRPPYIRAARVSRPRLENLIAQGLRSPLTLITAPAGFGKTTLAASCATWWLPFRPPPHPSAVKPHN